MALHFQDPKHADMTLCGQAINVFGPDRKPRNLPLDVTESEADLRSWASEGCKRCIRILDG